MYPILFTNMAFYHVNGCDCPVGCCDCGSPNVQDDASTLVWDYIHKKCPKDLFQLKEGGGDDWLYEKPRWLPHYPGKNEEFVDHIDPLTISVKDLTTDCLEFYVWLFKNDLLKYDSVGYMQRYINRMCMQYKVKKSDRAKVVAVLQPLFTRVIKELY